MRAFKICHILTICVAAFATPLTVSAQQPNGDAPPPPKLEPLEEGEAPPITIRKPEERAKIEEKRAPGGKVTEIKVTSGNSTYYLKPNDPVGFAAPGDGESPPARGAQWEVMEFDLGGSRQVKQAATGDAAAGVPPDVPVPSATTKK
jgi:hypothetical protein